MNAVTFTSDVCNTSIKRFDLKGSQYGYGGMGQWRDQGQTNLEWIFLLTHCSLCFLMWFFISHLILNLWLQCMHNYTFGFVYFHQKIWYQFIFFNNYLFLPVNCYLKHNLQIFPIFEGFFKPSLKNIFFLLTSFMVSSSIRTICLFRSLIVLVPFFPRLKVKVKLVNIFCQPLFFSFCFFL